jgi:ABC-type uncharacterized transport system YnjBCD permease subunit
MSDESEMVDLSVKNETTATPTRLEMQLENSIAFLSLWSLILVMKFLDAFPERRTLNVARAKGAFRSQNGNHGAN